MGWEQSGRRGVIELHPERKSIERQIALQTVPISEIAKRVGVHPDTVRRYREKIPDDRIQEILAEEAQRERQRRAEQAGAMVTGLGDEVDKDLRWVLRELKTLLDTAKDDDDRAMQLGTLKELRGSLMALAELQGKLAKHISVEFKLSEIPELVQFKTTLISALEPYPEAKAAVIAAFKQARLAHEQAG